MLTLNESFGRTDAERTELKAKTDALSAEARDNWDDPQWRRLMAQAITESIYWGFQHENVLQLLSNVENVPFDGRIFIKEMRGLRAFWTARGGYIEASNMRADVMELVRDTIGYHVYEFEDKVRTNFGETQANLIQLGQQRLDAEINLRVLHLFQAALPTSSAYTIQASTLSLTALDTALNDVFDETYEGTVTIVGRRSMVGQIIDTLTASNYGGFLPNTNEDLLRRGVLGSYKGANIVYLKNYRDDEDQAFFPANELYVVGRDASKFGFWGGPLSKDWTDESWYWHYIARQDFGGAIYRPERLRRFIATSITP
jgi:hypothetical protein